MNNISTISTARQRLADVLIAKQSAAAELENAARAVDHVNNILAHIVSLMEAGSADAKSRLAGALGAQAQLLGEHAAAHAAVAAADKAVAAAAMEAMQ